MYIGDILPLLHGIIIVPGCLICSLATLTHECRSPWSLDKVKHCNATKHVRNDVPSNQQNFLERWPPRIRMIHNLIIILPHSYGFNTALLRPPMEITSYNKTDASLFSFTDFKYTVYK